MWVSQLTYKVDNDVYVTGEHVIMAEGAKTASIFKYINYKTLRIRYKYYLSYVRRIFHVNLNRTEVTWYLPYQDI